MKNKLPLTQGITNAHEASAPISARHIYPAALISSPRFASPKEGIKQIAITAAKGISTEIIFRFEKPFLIPSLKSFGIPPSKSPAMVVKKSWRVNGRTGTGILINAPTAVSTVNRAQSVISLVVNVCFICKISP